MRPKTLAGDGGKRFHLRSKAAIEINEDQGDEKDADTVGGGKVVIGRKRAQRFAPNLRGEHFDARRQGDDRRSVEAFDGADEVQRSRREYGRAYQWKSNPPHDAEFARAESLGRFFQRRVHAFHRRGDDQKRQRRQDQRFDEDQPRHGVNIERPFLHAEELHEQAIDQTVARIEQHDPRDGNQDRRQNIRDDRD